MLSERRFVASIKEVRLSVLQLMSGHVELEAATGCQCSLYDLSQIIRLLQEAPEKLINCRG